VNKAPINFGNYVVWCLLELWGCDYQTVGEYHSKRYGDMMYMFILPDVGIVSDDY